LSEEGFVRLAGVTFGLAVGGMAIALLVLGGLNISYFLVAGVGFALVGVTLGWAAWWCARRM
jgi:hypothetical protein